MLTGLSNRTKLSIIVLICIALILAIGNVFSLAYLSLEAQPLVAFLNVIKDILTLVIILGLVKANLILLNERRDISLLLSHFKKGYGNGGT